MDPQNKTPKTLGQAIDELIGALSSIDEASRITAIKAACDHLHLPLIETASAPVASTPLSQPQTATPGAAPVPTRLVDIKSFRESKKPSSANEMAATVAYYLTEVAPTSERKDEVDTEDMVKYFKQAGFPLPKAPRMLLTNAKNSGYFDSGTAGGYKLNPVGYNLVAHNLPRTGSTSAPAKIRRRARQVAGGRKK